MGMLISWMVTPVHDVHIYQNCSWLTFSMYDIWLSVVRVGVKARPCPSFC